GDLKRTLTGVIAATVVLGTAIPMAFADSTYGPYSDTSGNQYATAINVMSNAGVVHGYQGGLYKPGQDLSRGQAVAYVYNILVNEGLITKHYTEKVQPYQDEDNFFRNQINDMYLYGYLNNLDLGNGSFGVYWQTPKPWLAALLCNVAGVQYDPSKPWDALNKARAAGWFDNTNDKTALGDTDDNGSKYYISRAEFAQVLENFYKAQFPNSKVLAGQVTNLAVQAKNDTIAVGQADQLSVTGSDLSGNTQNVDLSNVTFSVSPSDTGFVNSAGNFTATAPGTYTITATDGALTATTKVTVYGQPASLDVAAGSDLVADGASKATVTVKVLDSNGAVVQNYNGPVTLASANTSEVTVENNGQVNAVNGVATFTVDATGAAKAGDKITLTAGVPGQSNVSGTGSVTIDAATATSFKVGFWSGYPQGLAVNNGNPQTALQAQVLDQAGNPLTNVNTYVTATVSGPATFPNGSTTEQVWIGAGTSMPIIIQGKQGQSGNIVVTLSGAGFQNASFTVPAYIQTASASISASSSSSTVAVGAANAATVTVKVLDANGNLAVGENGTVTVSGLPNNVSLANFSVANGIGTGTLTNNGYVGSATLTFTYQNGGETFTTTLPVSFTQGAATQIVPVNVANNVYAAAGSTQTVTFQLEDAGGNPVNVAGDTFTLTPSGGATLSATSATTDANGQFSVNVTLPSQAPATAGLTVAPSGSTTGISNTTVNFNVQYGWNLANNVLGNVYDTGANNGQGAAEALTALNGTQLKAGDVVYGNVYG
ncbi:MAG: S-layer homology domain-containing protein, partial [Alicyclobacillus sp.]|nr:S-layer homology domain-containing protein [Alicyclobacillus sp.]